MHDKDIGDLSESLLILIKYDDWLDTSFTFSNEILSITKSLFLIGSPRAYFLRGVQKNVQIGQSRDHAPNV